MTWIDLALAAAAFAAGWLTSRTWHRFDAGLRDELRAIDRDRQNRDE